MAGLLHLSQLILHSPRLDQSVTGAVARGLDDRVAAANLSIARLDGIIVLGDTPGRVVEAYPSDSKTCAEFAIAGN